MRLREKIGVLEVEPGEPLTFQVTRAKGPFLAAISDLSGAAWTALERTATGESRRFQAPAERGSMMECSVWFGFLGSPEPYTVKCTGAGSTCWSETAGPPDHARTYSLAVGPNDCYCPKCKAAAPDAGPGEPCRRCQSPVECQRY